MKLAILALFAPVLALADEPPLVGEEIIKVENEYVVDGVNTSGVSYGSESMSYRAVSKGWMIVDGKELGAELRLLTADSFGGMSLATTDVAFLTLRARTQLGKRADLFGSVDLLPKQPSSRDELVWQGAALGVNVQPWLKRKLAFHARTSGGVLLARDGYWGQADAGATARKELHRIMLFEGGVSAMGTRLFHDDGDRAWLVEGAVKGSVLFHDPHGWTGGWLGFNYSLPVANAGGGLDPQPRLDLSVGAILSFVKNWDVFIRASVIDRGDANAMATQLPILDGGFDQQQIVVGVTYHSASEQNEDF